MEPGGAAPKAADVVAATLRRQIITGELPEGSVLPPEAALIEQFGVSRPTLREGFRILEAEGLVLVRRGSRGGARVLAPSGDRASEQFAFLLQHRSAPVAEVHAAAAHLGAGIAALAARNRTDHDLKAIDAALANLASAVADSHTDREPAAIAALLGEAERQLLATIVTAGGNRSLELVFEMVGFVTLAAMRKEIDRYGAVTLEDQALFEHALESVSQVVELIRGRRVEEARAAFFDYMMTTRERMLINSRDLVEILS